LLGSVETLSTPDNSAEMLRSLVDDMRAADNDMRNYIMSNDNASLQSYINTMEQISVELDDIKQDQAFEGQIATLDTLEEYFQDKADLMYSLVIFKQSSEYERLNSKAMQRNPLQLIKHL
jgi:exonuclease VII large subunit